MADIQHHRQRLRNISGNHLILLMTPRWLTGSIRDHRSCRFTKSIGAWRGLCDRMWVSPYSRVTINKWRAGSIRVSHRTDSWFWVLAGTFQCPHRFSSLNCYAPLGLRERMSENIFQIVRNRCVFWLQCFTTHTCSDPSANAVGTPLHVGV